MSGFLGPVEISAASERAYRRVLRYAPIESTALARRLGWDEAAVEEALAPLIERGLVMETEDGALEAEDPRVSIARLVESGLDDLRRRRGDLERTRNAIAHFAVDRGSARQRGHRPTWEVVPADLMTGVVLEEIQATEGPICSSVIDAEWSPEGIEQTLERCRRTVASGREMRCMYPTEALGSASAREWMRKFADAGEVQRIVREPLSEFVVFGEELVIATTEWGTLEADYVKVRDPMVVSAFKRLYDLAWSAGMPPPDETGDDAGSRRLLTLLAAGHKDETIARHLGVSLRTVRRRVSLLMDDMGVTTRFQLGMAVAASDRAAVTRGSGRSR